MSSGAESLVLVEGVGKKFRRGARHDSLRDLIPSLGRSLLAGNGRRREEFWALREIDFEVRPGEVLGIIGPNGAGKSTVLKLLTGILRPDEGRVVVRGRGESRGRGRIGALIELAAGFHFELTGRENIFLQGAVMGMRRAEIARKFDAIVEFAGVADFIDTPVKRYSSGMSARLGFAIAAHLDPEILVIDEVLAVGDLAFQRKAFARLEEMVRRDIPVIVVSHQLNRITELCSQAILLTRGRIIRSGSPAACVAAYVGEEADVAGADHSSPIRLDAISDPSPVHVRAGERVTVHVQGTVIDPKGCADATVGLRVRRLVTEEMVFTTNSADCGVGLAEAGEFTLEVELQMNVGAGIYRVQAVVWNRKDYTEWARGPSTLIEVERAPSAYGPVFPNPRMRLLAP
ncbi:hypothetical protein BH23GEM9_BH23GEM9_29130 [soil metagenome]